MDEVIVLQHVNCERPGTIADALRAAGFNPHCVHGYSGEAVPRELGGARGLVVMGGSPGVYEQDKYPYLKDELRLIEAALKNETPILGVCLGSQLLAAALGADVRPG